MKKFLLFFMLLLMVPIKVQAISAETAIVMDGDSGRVLFEKNINKQKLIASTTKIMTCIIAIENGNLSELVTVTDAVLKSYGSGIYIEIGEEITLMDLLYGLMLRSGNDAAMMIAENVGGSMSSFAHMMNLKAKEIGMKNTIFYNSHGLEEKGKVGNKSTAYDMALLTKYAMQNETFREIFGTKKHTTKTNFKTYVWNNKNKLLSTYEYTTGGKTGFTELARRTLVTTASKDGKNLIVVTLNDGNDFADHKALYEEYFNKFNSVQVLNKDTFEVKDDDYYKNGNLVLKNNFNILVTNEESDDIKTVVELDKVKKAKDNQRVGTIKIYLKDKLMHEEGIYFLKNETTEEKDGFWKKLWDFIKFWD